MLSHTVTCDMFGLNCGFDLKNIADLRPSGGVKGPNIWGSFRGPLPTDYDIILIIIVADAELPQPHYDSTLTTHIIEYCALT